MSKFSDNDLENLELKYKDNYIVLQLILELQYWHEFYIRHEVNGDEPDLYFGTII